MIEPKLTGREILVVENEPLIAMEVVQCFQEAGANVTTTTTLKQALILIEHHSLSAAVLDHSLADGHADQLCMRLKERNIPFIIYSGFSDLPEACQGAPQINKPASGDVLVTAIEVLLQSRTTTTAGAAPSSPPLRH
jgi:DNA-binding response OmpR family regulator